MKQWMRSFLIGSVCVLLVACGDRHIEGNGKVVSESRPAKAFSTLNIDGDFIVTLNSDQPAPLFDVKADQNLLPYIVNETIEGVLSIAVKPRYHLMPSTPIQIALNTQALKNVNLRGDATFIAGNLKGDNFHLVVEGAGTSVLKGAEKSVSLKVNGAAHINASELLADTMQVKMVGMPQLTVYAAKKLGVYMKGQGQLTFFGEP